MPHARHTRNSLKCSDYNSRAFYRVPSTMSLALQHTRLRVASAPMHRRTVVVRAQAPSADHEVANAHKVASSRLQEHTESADAPISRKQSIVDVLLRRAASNLTRGAATCIACKGTGACNCPACNGQGVLKPQAARMNVVRHAVQRVSVLLGLPRAAYNVEWLQTNRCRRCHGQGAVPCEYCNGAGVRHPQLSRQLITMQKNQL